MAKMIEALKRIKRNIIKAYQRHTDLDEDEVGKLMSAETWMDANEAVINGFATEVIEAVKVAAQHDPEQFSLNSFGWEGSASSAANIQPGTPAATKEEPPMSGKTYKPEDISADLIVNEFPAVLSALASVLITDNHESIKQLRLDAQVQGQQRERERIQGVLSQVLPGHEKLINELAFDGETTPEQAALKVLAAERGVRGQALADRRADAPDPVRSSVDEPEPVRASGPLDLSGDVRAQCQKRWDASKELREEFDGDLDSYVAFAVAEANGQVKMLHGARGK